MDWQDAERWVRDWLRDQGFIDAALTNSGADGGVDVLGSQIAAQVKAHAGAIGRPDVQALHGAATALGRSGAVFSTGGFTAQAVEWSTASGVALFELREDDMDVRPVNAPARSLATLDDAPSAEGARLFERRPSQTTKEDLKAFTSLCRRSVGALADKRSVKWAFELLAMHEPVFCVAFGRSRRSHGGLLVVTGHRLVLARPSGASAIPFDSIYRVEVVTRALSGAHLRFVAVGEQFDFSLLGRSTSADYLAAALSGKRPWTRHNTADKAQTPPTGSLPDDDADDDHSVISASTEPAAAVEEPLPPSPTSSFAPPTVSEASTTDSLLRKGARTVAGWNWRSSPAPSATAPPAPVAYPPGWYPDPLRQFDLRYWDGSSWTSHGSTAGPPQEP